MELPANHPSIMEVDCKSQPALRRQSDAIDTRIIFLVLPLTVIIDPTLVWML